MAKSRNGKRLKAESPQVGALVRHPNANGGLLRHGSLPGTNRGGGRLKDIVRLRAMYSWEQRIPLLEKIADRNVHDKPEAVCRAMDSLAKVAMSADPPRQTIGMMTDGKRVEVIVRYDDADET